MTVLSLPHSVSLLWSHRLKMLLPSKSFFFLNLKKLLISSVPNPMALTYHQSYLFLSLSCFPGSVSGFWTVYTAIYSNLCHLIITSAADVTHSLILPDTSYLEKSSRNCSCIKLQMSTQETGYGFERLSGKLRTRSQWTNYTSSHTLYWFSACDNTQYSAF